MDMFAALAEPTRRTIVEILATKGQLSASDICDRFPISPPAISQHLRVLREAKVVQMEKRGQQRLYQINPPAMLELEEWARHMTQLWEQRFDALDKLIEAEKMKLKKNQVEINKK